MTTQERKTKQQRTTRTQEMQLNDRKLQRPHGTHTGGEVTKPQEGREHTMDQRNPSRIRGTSRHGKAEEHRATTGRRRKDLIEELSEGGETLTRGAPPTSQPGREHRHKHSQHTRVEGGIHPIPESKQEHTKVLRTQDTEKCTQKHFSTRRTMAREAYSGDHIPPATAQPQH